MNKKGFLCFAILLVFSAISLSLESGPTAKEELSIAIDLAVEAEKVNFLRTILEENTDFIVGEVLAEETSKCDAKPSEIKQRLNSVLAEYFALMEKEKTGLKISFKAKSPEFLNENTALVVKKLSKVCEADYSFHGGILRNGFVSAEIKGTRFSQEFRIPSGYAHSEVTLSVS